MSVLTLATPPPAPSPQAPHVVCSPPQAPPAAISPPISPPSTVAPPRTDSDLTCRIPALFLDAPAVSEAAAAHLTSTLLAHVLFLKGQVPFPVAQLARIPGGDAGRAGKARTALLTALDTLDSHLGTTFPALVDALARGGRHGRARAYVVIALGPSIAVARARVVLALDGLEVPVWAGAESVGEWGARKEKGGADGDGVGDGDDSDDDKDLEGEDAGDAESESDSNENHEDECNDRDSGGDSDAADELDDDKSDESDASDASSPPPSRSPSPPPPSYAAQQSALHAAARLLTRTLAGADAAGRGLEAELPPTQTHVLLRAPRRFAHPAWIPQLRSAGTLDGVLDAFGAAAIAAADADVPGGRTRRARGVPCEGVWVGCRGAEARARGGPAAEGEGEGAVDERDEMIWWSWDGKIVGFSDW